ADELDRADDGGLGARADDDSGIVGELGEERRGVVEHLLQLAVGVGEEPPDLMLAGRVEWTGPAQSVDEVAIALVGGNAPGAGVWLGEIALVLQSDHLVANRRR